MLESEFSLSEDVCYLNHAAVSPWPARTVEVVSRFAEENGYQGSRNYEQWLCTEQLLRRQLRSLINAEDVDEIALLKSTSEALSVVAGGMDWSAGDEVILPSHEFPSNRIVWEALQDRGVRIVPVDIGVTDAPERALIEAISEHTRLLSVSSVQYSSGLRLDLVPLGNACRKTGVAFCVDAIQSLGALPFDVQACQADFVVADGHKWMLGPEGLALFYCRRKWIERLQLHQFGWHMVEAMGDFDRKDWAPASSARRFECGSPNMLGIHALHASLSLILETGIESIAARLSENIQYLIDGLSAQHVQFLSPGNSDRRAGIVTFRPNEPGIESRYRYLQENGVICALRGGGIRFSPHFYTSKRVLDRALDILRESCKGH